MPLTKLVEDYLYTCNAVEKLQLQKKNSVLDFKKQENEVDQKELRLLKKFFLKNNQISIAKHNRFAYYPEHRHDFLEINYLLKGECKQVINGKNFYLSEGDLLLFDKNCTHAIHSLSENDILINIIFPQESLDLDWMVGLKKENHMFFHFLIQDISENAKGKFIHFKGKENQDLQEILAQMLNKYFCDSTFSYDILKFYIPILFMELIGNTPFEVSGEINPASNNEVTLQCLKIISEQYRTLTLEKLSNLIGYNKNYLSNFLKDKTGNTFTDLINQEKMRHAIFLLETSNFSIQKISESVGFSSKNYFYKKFCEKYTLTPMKYRKQIKGGS